MGRVLCVHKIASGLKIFPLLLLPMQTVAMSDTLQNAFYAGVSVGVGSTTWSGLVPSYEKQNMAMAISTPTHVEEGGNVSGILLGYELTPYFSLEANYRRFPKSMVYFDPDSIYAFEHDERISFVSKTTSKDLLMKVMLLIPGTMLKFYSGAGVAMVSRQDEINSYAKLAPSFSVGLNFNITRHMIAGLDVNYTAGYGEAELQPANDYLPFLYSGTFRLAYKF